MKKNSVLAIIAMAILATTVAVVSCKKEKQEQTTNNDLVTSQLSEMDREMLAFGERLKSAEESEEVMPLKEAVRTLSNYQNFLLCDANVSVPDMICDTFEVMLPVCDGMVQLVDLKRLLDVNKANILARFNTLDGNGKTIYCITSKIMEEGSTEQSARIQTITLMHNGPTRDNPAYPVLFDSTDHWQDFCYAGKCGDYVGQCVGMDALTKLQRELRGHLSLPAGPGSIYFTDEMEVVDIATNYPNILSPNGYYTLPYVNDTSNLNCVSPEEMLWYYNKIRELYGSYATYYGKSVTHLSLLRTGVGLTPAQQCVLFLKLYTVNYSGYEREDP